MTATSRLGADTRRRLAQGGLYARGILYCLVGLIALGVAVGGGGTTEQASQTGALQELSQRPFGTILVALVGVGLIAYALWRSTQFFTERNRADSDMKNAVLRASYLVRALIYLGLAYVAFTIAFGGGSGGSSGGGGSSQAMTARIMGNVPGGVFIVGFVGAIIIVVGLYQAYQAFTDDFMQKLRQHEMTPAVRQWVRRIGIAGHTARAIVYALIGFFVIRAALEFDPQQAKGLDGALQELAQQPYGRWLLAAVALGLLLYGVFTFAYGRYVKVD